MSSPSKSRRLTTAEIIIAGLPALLIVMVLVTVLVAPKIIQSWEKDRCLEMNATFDDEKGECVVTKREKR